MRINIALQIIFWTSAALFTYTYVGYPLLIFVVSFFKGRKIEKSEIEPKVTVLITAYNEEDAIEQKLINTLAIDYPKDKLQILVASDGSDDRTDEIVKAFESKGVELFHQAGRKGKTFTQNKAVEKATGEIILFSDATTTYRENILRRVLPSFGDNSVGCVAGKLVYVDDSNSDIGKGAKSYWNYETFLKEYESRVCSLIGASGCLYAVRKSAYLPMYPEACSDFLICTVLFRQGLRSVYEPSAICTEETNQRGDSEIMMRIRVISQTFTDLWRNRDMLNPLKSGFFAVELLSHKLLRYAVPLFLFTILLSSSLLAVSDTFYFVITILQLLFYGIALISWLLERNGLRLGALSIPYYFVLANFASVIGFYKFLRGENYQSWDPIR